VCVCKTVVSALVNSEEKYTYFILYQGNGKMSDLVFLLLQMKGYRH